MKNYKFKLNNKDYSVDILAVEETLAKLKVNGETYEVQLQQDIRTTKTPTLVRPLAVPSTESSPSTVRTASPDAPKGSGAGIVKSPLPGKILDIMVKPGDVIKVGQALVCLEAMKMENNIKSDREGTVVAIHTQKGDTVLEGDALIEIG